MFSENRKNYKSVIELSSILLLVNTFLGHLFIFLKFHDLFICTNKIQQFLIRKQFIKKFLIIHSLLFHSNFKSSNPLICHFKILDDKNDKINLTVIKKYIRYCKLYPDRSRNLIGKDTLKLSVYLLLTQLDIPYQIFVSKLKDI